MNSSTYKERVGIAFVLCGCAATLALSLCADTYNVASGETETHSGLTESSRTIKSGDGTLVLSGDNTLYGLETKAGTLRLNGGTTTVDGPGGTSSSAGTFGQGGGVTIIEGGATVKVWNAGGVGWAVATDGGDLMITNGTFQPVTYTPGSGKEFLHAMYATSNCRLIVQDEGVFKWPTVRACQTYKSELADVIGIFLNAGGQMYVDRFSLNESGCYASIRYNGGTLHMTSEGNLYTGTASRWDNVKSYVDAGGFHLVNDVGTVTIDKPLFTGTGDGEPDGGVHFISTKTVRLSSANSTFKGGTWLEGNMTLQNFSGSDGAFGAVPSSPTTNIFIKGNVTIFGGNGSDNYILHRNRNIAIDARKTVTIGANSSGTGFRIGGEIAVPDGEGCQKDTIVKFGGWDGLVVLDTGDGRTNRLDRVQVLKRLEIASGTTVVRSPSNGTGDIGPIYIAGNAEAYSDSAGRLTVSGGKLVIEGGRYFNANKYAQVVVNGGTISAMADYAEYLNGLGGGPAKLTVENGGLFECFRVRVSQSNAANEINVNTGGVLRTAYLMMSANSCSGTVNLNGGTIVAYESSTVSSTDAGYYRNNFIGDGSSKWDNVIMRVLAGGAKFNTDGYSPKVNVPLVSGVGGGETDGGLTKSGSGTLMMTKTSTYNGPTRLDGGTLKFADTGDASGRGGRPDTDIEFTAEALMDCAEHPFVEAPSLGMGAGKVIRVVGAEDLDDSQWQGKWHVVATFENEIDALPDVVFALKDGTVVSTSNGWNNWTFRISADGRSLEFKRLLGTAIVVR